MAEEKKTEAKKPEPKAPEAAPAAPSSPAADATGNGKGDAPRNIFSDKFRQNFQSIDWSK